MNDGLRLSLAKQVILSVQISTWKPNKRKRNSLNKANTSLFGRVVVWRGRAVEQFNEVSSEKEGI